jgi:hypothetical protein
MAESSAESSGGSRQYSSYSGSRSSSPRELNEFSSEEELSSAKSKVPEKKTVGSGAPKLKAKSPINNAGTNAGFFRTGSGKKPGMGFGAPGTPNGQLSATIIESASSPAPSPRSSSVSSKKKLETDDDNDARSPLIGKDMRESFKGRTTGKTSALLKRKETAKARTASNIKTTGTTTTTSTTTTTTTTTTTATTVPVYKASSSSSEEVASASSQEKKRTSIASTREKRRSYIASSVQPDQQSITAVKNAKSISDLPSSKQSAAFEKTLGMIEQMKPDSRCAPLVNLTPALRLLGQKEQAVYLPRLRRLASPPMSMHDRKKVIDALVCAYAGCAIDGADSDHPNLDGEDSDTEHAYPPDDAKTLRSFQQQIKDAKLKIHDVIAPVKQRSTDTIQQVLQDMAKSEDVCLKLEYAIGFLDALDNHHDTDKKVIVDHLLDAFGDEIVTTALLIGLLSKELEKYPEIKISPSAMLLGFIEGDKNVVIILEDFVTKTARAKPFLNAFYQRLLERSREMSTPGKHNPRIAAATMYLLMDMAASSQLPEASRCMLIMYLYSMDPKALYQALCSTRKQHGEAGFDFAHRVIAAAIGVSGCSRLLPESADNKMEHLASYQDRIDAANGKEKQPRLQPRAKHLRALLLDSNGDAAEVMQAVRKVLASNASFDDKRVQLQVLETVPLTDALPAYVEKFYFETADAYLNELNPDKTRHLPDMHRLRTEKRPYYDTLSRIHKKLPPEKVAELRKETKEAHDKALNSTLPAVHAAIMNNNVGMVKAYLNAVLDPASNLSSNQAMELISMPHKGKSAFYRALMRGTPDMIRTFMEAILASKLDETHKVDLLLARRESDNFGAFYIAMSSRNTERVKAFMEAVLTSNLLSKNKEKLLKCKKELGKGAAASRNKISELYLNAQLYARSEAARNEETWASREQKITTYDKISYGARKIPSKVNPKIKRDPAGLRNREEIPSLVALFDDLIDKSDLHSSTKDILKDKPSGRKPLPY